MLGFSRQTTKKAPACRIDNDAMTLAAEIAKRGERPEMVLGAAYGWYWAADVLADKACTHR